MSALKVCLPALSAIALLQAPAAATEAQGSIVVEGQRVHSQVDDFVRKLTTNVKNDQLGRFVEDVCPAILGLSPDLADDITARVRRVAAAIGALVGKSNCAPNVVLLVVHDKSTAINQLRTRLPGVFGDMRVADINKLVEMPGPTASWQISSRLGADYMPLMMVQLRDGQGKFGGSNTAVPVVRSMGFISRTNMQIMRQFDLSLVIVEARALDQVDTRQLADYTVMRALAATPASADLPAPSILQLFNPGVSPVEAPESVTWWDYAFLKSLYRSSNRVEASAQRAQVTKLMASELRKLPTEQR